MNENELTEQVWWNRTMYLGSPHFEYRVVQSLSCGFVACSAVLVDEWLIITRNDITIATLLSNPFLTVILTFDAITIWVPDGVLEYAANKWFSAMKWEVTNLQAGREPKSKRHLFYHIVPASFGTHCVSYATLFQQAVVLSVSPMPRCSSRLWYSPCLLCHVVPAGCSTHRVSYATLFQQAVVLTVSPMPRCSSRL